METVKKELAKLVIYLKDILFQWIWPFAIYVKAEDGTPLKDPVTKKYLINWTATVVARVLSVVTAVWGTTEVLGVPLFKIVDTVLTYLGFVN